MPKHVCGARELPYGLLGYRCRAPAIKTKRGAWRCPLHGGLSTGPKSPEGKARIGAAARQRWGAYRAAKAARFPENRQIIGTALAWAAKRPEFRVSSASDQQ